MDLNLYNISELLKTKTAADGREAVCGDKELNDGTKSEATEKNVGAKIERRGTKKQVDYVLWEIERILKIPGNEREVIST